MVSVENFTKEQMDELHFTQAEMEQLERARKMEPSFDDCPEVTPELALKFRRVNPVKKAISI